MTAKTDDVDDVGQGRCCSSCTTYFEKAHGYPVICRNCKPAWSKRELEQLGLKVATHKEA